MATSAPTDPLAQRYAARKSRRQVMDRVGLIGLQILMTLILITFLAPTLWMVDMIPGMEMAAPLRTDSRSGRSGEPKIRPVSCSRLVTADRTRRIYSSLARSNLRIAR